MQRALADLRTKRLCYSTSKLAAKCALQRTLGLCYYDWPGHTRMPTRHALCRYEQEHAWLSSADVRDSVVYYKSHEFAPSLLRLCREPPIILTTHRCLRSAVHSAVASGMVNASAFAVRKFVLDATDWWASWRAAGAYDVSYEAMASNPEGAFINVSRYLGTRLRQLSAGALSARRAGRAAKREPSRQSAALRKPANLHSPHREVNASVWQRIEQAIRAVQLELSNSSQNPVRKGLAWC